LGLYTHSHGSKSIHENGKRERAPALMRGISRSRQVAICGIEHYQRDAGLAEARPGALGQRGRIAEGSGFFDFALFREKPGPAFFARALSRRRQKQLPLVPHLGRRPACPAPEGVTEGSGAFVTQEPGDLRQRYALVLDVLERQSSSQFV
jgi:hypothetical protein